MTFVGRHVFDITDGWAGKPPGGVDHVVVVAAAGDVGGQVLAAGLIDEVRMDVVPVVFGSGKRYFGSAHAQHLLEDPDVVIQATGCFTGAIRCGVDTSRCASSGEAAADVDGRSN